MQRFLILLGAVFLLVGLAWPWLGRLGPDWFRLGHLPGDIVVERPHFRFYFPLATSLLLSVILSLVLWLMRR